MDLKNNQILSNISELTKKEKSKKTMITYIIIAICCSIMIFCNINFIICVVLSIICGFCYFLFAPTPKIKPKKEKKEKKRSSLDEEYLREYDEAHEVPLE